MLAYARHFLLLACLLAMPATAQEDKVAYLLTIDGANSAGAGRAHNRPTVPTTTIGTDAQ